MTEKQAAAMIAQQKKTNLLLGEILKELRKDDDIQKNNELLPELLDNEKQMAFAHVIKDGYIYTFCYGRYVEHKKATNSEIYMYRNASSVKCDRNASSVKCDRNA